MKHLHGCKHNQSASRAPSSAQGGAEEHQGGARSGAAALTLLFLRVPGALRLAASALLLLLCWALLDLESIALTARVAADAMRDQLAVTAEDARPALEHLLRGQVPALGAAWAAALAAPSPAAVVHLASLGFWTAADTAINALLLTLFSAMNLLLLLGAAAYHVLTQQAGDLLPPRSDPLAGFLHRPPRFPPGSGVSVLLRRCGSSCAFSRPPRWADSRRSAPWPRTASS